jgi:hypothetical protein
MTRRIGNAVLLPTFPSQAGNPAVTFVSIRAFLRRTHPPYGWPDVGRVCSARVGSNSPQTPPQNYPPDWERLAPPTLPNQAGNPASTSISIQAFLRRTHPPYGWAGVFCASEIESSPDTTAELPAGLEAPRPPTFPNQAGNPTSPSITIQAFFRRTHPPYGWSAYQEHRSKDSRGSQ